MTTTSGRGGNYAFLDDDFQMVTFLREWQRTTGARLIATEDPDEFLTWAQEGRIARAYSDLRMSGVSGVEVLAQIHRIDPGIETALVTGYRPDPAEEAALVEIGATIFRKSTELRFLLRSIEQGTDVDDSVGDALASTRMVAEEAIGEARNLRAALEPYISLLSESLQQIEDQDTVIVKGGERFSVGDLLDDLERGTERGLRYVRLLGDGLKSVKQLLR